MARRRIDPALIMGGGARDQRSRSPGRGFRRQRSRGSGRSDEQPENVGFAMDSPVGGGGGRGLASNQSVLRKITREPAPGDRPNAISPDSVLGGADAPVHMRAPQHLRDLVLHLRTGHTLSVPPSGVVEINAAHTEVQDALREHGFTQLRGITRSGRAADGGPDPAEAFHRDRLTRIGGGDADLLRALGARAIKAAVAPIERRIESDDRAPSMSICSSLEEFYRRYLGRTF
jgi:hypothetical protein